MNQDCPISHELNITINIIYPPQKSNRMDNEKLLKAQELANTINATEQKLKNWEKATNFHPDKIDTLCGAYITNYVYTADMDFDLIKAVTVTSLTKKLQQAKAEFEVL